MKGIVYWITGLSGAGKTTIGKELYHIMKQNKNNIVILDGDELRKVFGNDLGYSQEDRKKCAMRYSNICKMLSDQGIDVICCTISMFHEIREWNRENIERYKEIYIKVPIDILRQRNQKELYSGVEKGSKMNVAGMDMDVEFPLHPDITIENLGNKLPKDIAYKILDQL